MLVLGSLDVVHQYVNFLVMSKQRIADTCFPSQAPAEFFPPTVEDGSIGVSIPVFQRLATDQTMCRICGMAFRPERRI